MKNKKRIVSICSIVLIVILLFIANSMVGNPVSKALAKRAAKQYIDINYSELNLQIKRAGYNFKFGEYLIFAQSSTSEDTAFSLYANSFGRILRDDYEYEVANNFTTFRRIDSELREIGEEIIGSMLDYDVAYAAFALPDEADLMKLERDMELDIHKPPLPLTIKLEIYSEDVSYQKIAEVAKTLESILQEQAIPVCGYNVRIIPPANKPQKEEEAASWGNSLSVSEFPAERMSEENLPQVMEQFETERIAMLNEAHKK